MNTPNDYRRLVDKLTGLGVLNHAHGIKGLIDNAADTIHIASWRTSSDNGLLVINYTLPKKLTTIVMSSNEFDMDLHYALAATGLSSESCLMASLS